VAPRKGFRLPRSFFVVAYVSGGFENLPVDELQQKMPKQATCIRYLGLLRATIRPTPGCVTSSVVRIRNEFPQILKPLKRSLFQEFGRAFTVYLFNQLTSDLDSMHVHGS